ncbi:hypothetical protein CBR_g405 [Chara braunii]|uniref:Uncharacterized protein n=1 Tax=Chara braunii TaxID=69332 RepID=A0A388JQJ0_CHABU|nr:hypothetical protein CBR_g405 [Chara braunii]|eukprot:GBG60074.1 hypothetical protein CBR_g405 [Chara braunii]
MFVVPTVQAQQQLPQVQQQLPSANAAPSVPVNSGAQYAIPPIAAPWAMQPWAATTQWPAAIPWPVTPAGNPLPPPPPLPGAQVPSVQAPSVQVQSAQGGDFPGSRIPTTGENRSSNLNQGKGPAANAFPGSGNRVYFTKEYMDILEDIKSEKALDAAKKKVAGSRLGGVQISDTTNESCKSEVRLSSKLDEMKAWVTSTLGDSLKLITQKLEEVDSKSKLAATEKEELMRLRAEKAALEKVKKEASSEKRKREAVVAPVVVTPANTAKSRSRGSSRGRSRRVEISSDEEDADVGQVKKMLASIAQSLADVKGKQPVVDPEKPPVAMHGSEEDTEDVDVAANSPFHEEEEVGEGGLAAYMKMRQDFYMSLHYTRVQEICKQREISYFRKEPAAWELARLDLQEYADQLNGNVPNGASGVNKGAEPSRKTTGRTMDNSEIGNEKGGDSIQGTD